MTEPAAPEPLSFYQGQPISREQAAERRQALAADPEFQERIRAKDANAFSEHTKLWRLEHGLPAEPVPPATPEEVHAQMTDRDREIDDARVDTYAKFISDFDDQKRATIARGLATKEQHDEAVRELERMRRDGVFARRVLAGDNAAVDAWSRFNLIAAMQVAPDNYDWSK